MGELRKSAHSQDPPCTSTAIACLLLLVVVAGVSCGKSLVSRGLVECVNVAVKSSEAIWPTWSPDGSQIAFFGMVDSAGAIAQGIYVVSSSGGARRALFASGPSFFPPEHLSWSPDGRFIAFAFENDI